MQCRIFRIKFFISKMKIHLLNFQLSYISVKNENIDQVYFSKGTCNAIPIYFHYNHQLSLLHNCFHQSCGFYNDWNLIMSINVPCSDYAIMKCNCFACIGTVHNFPLLAFNHYNALTHSPKKCAEQLHFIKLWSQKR